VKSGFVIYEFPSGDKYEGNWKNDLMHGKGTYYYPNGNKYEGEFKNGRKTGFGIKSMQHSYYIGEWYNDAYNG